MGALSTKILSYSPEVYYPFNDNPFPTNNILNHLGSQANQSWTRTGGTPTPNPTGGPDGSGSLQWPWTTAEIVLSEVSSTDSKVTPLQDGDFSLGFWFKCPSVEAVSLGEDTRLFAINSTGTNGDVGGFILSLSDLTSPSTNNGKLLFEPGTRAQFTAFFTTDRYDDNAWHYLAFRATTSGSTVSQEIFLDGTSLLSYSSTLAANTNENIAFGDTFIPVNGLDPIEFSDFYIAPASSITPTAIAEIWATVNEQGSTNATILESPATANAEISYLSVSGNANFEHSFAPATAIFTMPTLAFTFNDNTEIVTSITASAEFREPFNFSGEANISTSAQLMEASADIGSHDIVAGSSISYPAEEATASALFVEPARFGPDDTTQTASPFVASATTGTNTIFVTPNQFNFIKRNNPLLYIRDYSGVNAVLLNEGSLDFGPVDKGIITSSTWAITQQASGNPLSFIGNGTSPSLIQPYSTDQGRFRYTDSTFYTPTLSTMYANKAFTHEFWYKPVNTTSGGGAFNSSIIYSDRCLAYTLTHTPTSLSFVTTFGSSLETTTFSISASTSILTHQNWHHIVILAEPVGSTQMKIGYYVDGALINTSTQTFLHSQEQIASRMSGGTPGVNFSIDNGSSTLYTAYDELAMYPNTLSNSEITTHYNFVDTLSPNKLINADEMTAEAQTRDPSIFAVANKVFPATPITATSLFVDPIIEVSTTIGVTALTASALSVNPSFFGTPDYRQDAEVMIASAEKGNNSFALDGTYFSYVQLNIAPFRYVSFDSDNPYFDYGTDNDYSVVPTSVGGTITSAADGLNNRSAKTAGTNYTTDGVILKESEWNDTWGTGQNTNHSSFWVKRAGNDTSTSGIRILWNLNGYKDNQHAILYQINNKLHMQFNNGSGTFVDQATVADVNLFDYERHHVVIVFDHTNNNNNSVKLYVDSVLVMTVSLGAYTGTTTNYATFQPANDESYNKPRLGVGCLITPFGSTALSAEPQNTILYVDEVHWAVTGLNQTQVTDLYNIMPIKDSVEWYADFFLGLNGTLVNPTFGTGNTRTAVALTASANIVQPQILTVYNNIITVTPMSASAEAIEPAFFGDNITNINYSAEFMLASAFITVPVVTITVPGQPMLATLEFATSTNPYLDDYRLLILDQTLFQSFNTGSFGGSYAIGDID